MVLIVVEVQEVAGHCMGKDISTLHLYAIKLSPSWVF